MLCFKSLPFAHIPLQTCPETYSLGSLYSSKPSSLTLLFLPSLAFHVILYLPLSFPVGGRVVRVLCGSKRTALASFVLVQTPPSYLPLAPSPRRSVLVQIFSYFIYILYKMNLTNSDLRRTP